MRNRFLLLPIALLAAMLSRAEAQFVLDCACLAQHASLTVTNCQAAVPDLCALTTNCFRGTVVPPPPLNIINCNQTPAAGSPVGPGTYIITVTVQLAGLAPMQCVVPFTVVPPITGPFSLQCAPSKTVNCDAQWNFDPPTVVNPCCPNAALPNGGATVSVVSTVTNGVCPQVITRTWNAVDICGQSDTCSQTVTVVDTVPPTISCGPNQTVNCGAPWSFSTPTISDNCTAPSDLVLTIVSTTTSGVCPQVITRVWKVADLCGNSATCTETVTVVDTTPPMITCGPNQTVNCGTPWNFSTPTISDNCSPQASLVLSIVSTVTNGACPEVITRVWLVTDLCGNKATCTEVVTVQDITAPTITCAPGKTVECGTQWAFDPPTATDACSVTPAGIPNITIAVVGTVTNGTCPEIITRTWSATDACGNSSQCNQTVTVVDTTPPVLDCACLRNNPAVPLTVTGCSNAIPDLCLLAIGLAPSCATDNCGPLTCSQSPAAGTIVGPGVYPITITVYDCALNSASCTVLFTVIAPPGGCVTNPPPCPPTLSGTLNTGTANGNGAVLSTGAPEQVWVNVSAPGGPIPMVVVDINQYPIVAGPWLPASTVSAWVSPSVNSQGPAGWYTNRVIFNADCTNVCLTGRIASDDDGYLYVNGVFVTGSGFTAWSNVNHCADFVKGPNVIEFVVHNAGGPTGFRTELEFYERCCCNTYTNAWNTGMDGTNALATGQPDPNYVLVSAPPGGCTGPAQVLNPLSLPVGPWIANGPNSQWIGAGPNADCQEGVYHYRLCFYLPCADGASIIGQWAVDDAAVMLLNGQPTGNTIPSLQYPNLPAYGWFPVSITSGFICGTNCLDFYVTNALIGVNPTGFRAELTNVFDDCCCGPLQEVSSYHSGVNAGVLMPQNWPDPQLVLSCAPPGVAIGPAEVTNPNALWLLNGPDSLWLAPVGNPNLPGGDYCYTYRFTLPPCTNGTPNYAVKGQWAGDDAGTIYVNGVPTGNNLPNGWAFTSWSPISITSGLVPGPNTLTFFVTNASFGYTGIRVELTNYASCCDCTNTCAVSIKCPGDIVREICGTQGHIIYPAPITGNSCGLPVSVVCLPPSNTVFPLGTTTVNCTATDTAGHTASCSFKVILTPDSTPPVIDCTCVQAAIPPRVNACSYTVPDLCQLQNCFSDNCTPPGQLTCSQSPPAGTVLSAGASYIITLTVTDAAGNVSAPCQIGVSVIAPVETHVWNTGAASPNAANFTVIQTPGGPANIPAVLTLPAPWLPNDAVSSWISFTPNSSSAAAGVYIYRLTFTVPCTNGASIAGRFMSDDAARIFLNGVPTAALSTSFNTWTPVSLTSGFVSGVNTLDIYVTNAVIWTGIRTELTNNFNCCCPSAIVLNCPPRPVNAWTCGNAPVPVSYNVTASSLCSNVTVSVKCVPPSGSSFPANTSTLVTCTATDSLGNTTSCTFPVTVTRDTIPPVITCPGPITRVLCTNSVAVYYKVIAKDDCSPTVSVTCVPPSGTVFNTGTTIVTCTATDACGNQSSCSFPVKIINNLLWQTLPAGINDCYAQSGWEPNSPGACLNTAYPGGNWKNFDVTTVNKWVGHTWTFPVSWNILAAQLATRARPPVNGCYGISGNDSISLGLANCSPATWLWSRYLGAGNASPGLVDKQWCDGTGCQYLFNFNLASMPLVPSGTISLLPHMNSAKRLDFFAQDDTTVDFAHLRVLRCAPTHTIGGVAVELNNARIAYGPAIWCIIRDVVANPTLRADFSLGLADGVRFPMEPVTLGDHPGSSIQIEGVTTDSVSGPRLELGLDNGDGSAAIHLNGLPPGVPVLRLALEINGTVVQTVEVPASEGMLLATFDSSSPVVALELANQNELLATIIENEPDQAPRTVTLRVSLPGYGGGFHGASLHATALSEVTVEAPQLQFGTRTGRHFPEVKIKLRSSDASLTEISGGQAVLSPLDSESTDPVSFIASFPPTDEFRAVVPSPFGLFAPMPTNAELRVIVRGTIDQDDDGDGVPTVTEGDVDMARFKSSNDSLYPFDFTWSSARVHPVRRIYWVYGPSGATRLEFPGGSNVVVNLAELPVMQGKLGGRTPCRRLTWPKPTSLRVSGQNYEATELRVLVETDNYPVTALTGLRVEAVGAESLTLPVVDIGPNLHALDVPERAEESLFIRWSGFGGLLEEATDVLGPWAPTPGQFDQTQGEVLTPLDPAARVKVFRVRGD